MFEQSHGCCLVCCTNCYTRTYCTRYFLFEVPKDKLRSRSSSRAGPRTNAPLALGLHGKVSVSRRSRFGNCTTCTLETTATHKRLRTTSSHLIQAYFIKYRCTLPQPRSTNTQSADIRSNSRCSVPVNALTPKVAPAVDLPSGRTAECLAQCTASCRPTEATAAARSGRPLESTHTKAPESIAFSVRSLTNTPRLRQTPWNPE